MFVYEGGEAANNSVAPNLGLAKTATGWGEHLT